MMAGFSVIVVILPHSFEYLMPSSPALLWLVSIDHQNHPTIRPIININTAEAIKHPF